MKNQWKWLTAALALVIILPLAVILYGKLSKEYSPDDLPVADTSTTQMTSAQENPAYPEPETTQADYTFGELPMPENNTAPDPAATVTVPTATKAPDPTTTKAPDPTTTKAPDPTTTKAPEPPKDLAADFVVYDENNNPVRLSDHFGKPIVVNFWASWCGPCRSELPAFDEAAKQYAGTIDFMMVNLTDGDYETVSSVQTFLQDSGYTFPVYYDTRESASNAYSIYSIPLTVFIRADGTVMTSRVGSMEASTLQSYLRQLTA